MKKLKKVKTSTKVIIVVAIVLDILLVWGFIGSNQATTIGTTCDFGLGDNGNLLCWKWHRNVVGQIGDALGNLIK